MSKPESLPTADLGAATTLIRIGYWERTASMAAGPEDTSWPRAQDMVDDSWDAADFFRDACLARDDVADHLERGFVARAYMGLAPCRLCSQVNGALELTDGTFLWPQGLPHYVRHHAVRLPHVFLEHVIAVRDAIEAASVEESWWKSLRVAD